MPPHTSDHTSERYRPDIDGLRAIAILGVVAYHVGIPGITGGFSGVDVFFVISGYLITQLLARELTTTGTLSIGNFYARRMRRLLPALVLVVLVTLALSWVLLPPAGEREELAKSALASLVFVANYFFMKAPGGYFGGPAELKPLVHLWSLSVEEQFYVVWPLVLLAIASLTRSQTRLTWMRRAIGVITVTSFVFSAWLVRHNLTAAFYSAPPRAWELGTGALLSLSSEAARMGHAKLGRAAAAAGALLIMASFMLVQSSTHFPGPAAVPAVLGTAMVIWGNAQGPTTLLYRLLSSRVMVAIGVTSYGWYLWHWPILSYLRGATLMRASVGSAIVGAVLAYLLAALSLKYVETPIRRGTFVRNVPTARVLRWGIASILVMALAASATWAWAAYGPRSNREQLAARVASDMPNDANYDCMIEEDAWTGTLPTDRCFFGARGRGIDLVLWGDSHGMALSPLLLALQQNGAPTFLQLTMGNCLPLAQQSAGSAKPSNPCAEFNRQVLQEILQLKMRGLKGVVLAGRWIKIWDPALSPYYLPPRAPGVRDLLKTWIGRSDRRRQAAIPAADRLTADLGATLEILQYAGLKVFVFLDPPDLPWPLSNCVYFDFSDLARCGISRAEYDSQAAQIIEVTEALASRFASVRIFNPMQYLCNATTCPPFIDGWPILWDRHHMSASTARSFGPIVANDFRWLEGSDEMPAPVAAPGAGHTGP
jgi:peptidoglycan/LPS O-acetylase OafA/YrhL